MTIIFHKEFLLQFVRWYYSMYKLSWHCQQQKCLLALSLVRHFEAGGVLRFLRTEWMTRFAEWNTSSLGVVFHNLSKVFWALFLWWLCIRRWFLWWFSDFLSWELCRLPCRPRRLGRKTCVRSVASSPLWVSEVPPCSPRHDLRCHKGQGDRSRHHKESLEQKLNI